MSDKRNFKQNGAYLAFSGPHLNIENLENQQADNSYKLNNVEHLFIAFKSKDYRHADR